MTKSLSCRRGPRVKQQQHRPSPLQAAPPEGRGRGDPHEAPRQGVPLQPLSLLDRVLQTRGQRALWAGDRTLVLRLGSEENQLRLGAGCLHPDPEKRTVTGSGGGPGQSRAGQPAGVCGESAACPRPRPGTSATLGLNRAWRFPWVSAGLRLLLPRSPAPSTHPPSPSPSV